MLRHAASAMTAQPTTISRKPVAPTKQKPSTRSPRYQLACLPLRRIVTYSAAKAALSPTQFLVHTRMGRFCIDLRFDGGPLSQTT